MSVSSPGAPSNAHSYLQSLLAQRPAGENAAAARADPVAVLLQAFYPAGGQPSTPAAAASSAAPASGTSPFSPDTMAHLISLQARQGGGGGADAVAARAQSLFTQFDADGDGQISKSEFENVFGPTADTSKVDGLFDALDNNGDGSVSQSELTAAAQQSRARHHHHHHVQSQGSSDALNALMSATQGATTQTSSNADGSKTTTISYADGSKVTMTIPAASTAGSSSGGSGRNGAGNNTLEELIRLQAQLLTPSTPGAASA